jgi:hypothetical protein
MLFLLIGCYETKYRHNQMDISINRGQGSQEWSDSVASALVLRTKGQLSDRSLRPIVLRGGATTNISPERHQHAPPRNGTGRVSYLASSNHK